MESNQEYCFIYEHFCKMTGEFHKNDINPMRFSEILIKHLVKDLLDLFSHKTMEKVIKDGVEWGKSSFQMEHDMTVLGEIWDALPEHCKNDTSKDEYIFYNSLTMRQQKFWDAAKKKEEKSENT